MSSPIKPEDIKKGDHIRKEYPLVGRNFSQTAVEYIAIFDGETSGSNAATFYLLDRPKPAVVLPTEPGWYEASEFPLETGGNPYQLIEGVWRTVSHEAVTIAYLEAHVGGLTLLRPVAEVAAEVVTFISEAIEGPNRARSFSVAFAAAKAKFGVTQ